MQEIALAADSHQAASGLVCNARPGQRNTCESTGQTEDVSGVNGTISNPSDNLKTVWGEFLPAW